MNIAFGYFGFIGVIFVSGLLAYLLCFKTEIDEAILRNSKRPYREIANEANHIRISPEPTTEEIENMILAVVESAAREGKYNVSLCPVIWNESHDVNYSISYIRKRLSRASRKRLLREYGVEVSFSRPYTYSRGAVEMILRW